MIATGSVLDLSRNTLTVEDDVMPIRVNKHPGLQASSDFIWDFGKLPFPTHLGKYFIKIGKIRAKIHEIGKIKAIFGLGMTPIYGLKNGQIKSLASNVSIVRGTVIQPQSVGFVPAKLDSPIDGSYIVSGASNKKALVSNVFGNGISVILKVVNDSDSYVTFKKGKSIGHAESAELVHNNAEHFDISKTTQSGAEQAGTAI